MLKISRLSVVIDTKTILDDVSFEVQTGEVFGLLGPNGSGKSTTLAVVAGLVQAAKGSVQWQNPDAAQGLSVVFQTPSLDKRLTVSQNLLLTCRLFGMPKRAAQIAVTQELTKSDLIEHASQKVMSLSGGLKRRVDLVRAMLSNPSLLILDEPTSGLDESSFRKFWEYLMAIKASKQNTPAPLTLLLATHNPRESEHCQRVAIFSRAKLVEVATPQELKKRLSKDVVHLCFGHESEATSASEVLNKELALVPTQIKSELTIYSDQGAKLIPKITDVLDAGSLIEVSLKAASMSDVFFKITGEELGN